MTNEEAKIIIGNIPINPEILDDCYSIAEYQEAKAMAIKALEQQQDVHDTCIEDYPTCTECEHYDSEKHYCPRFCQVIKDTLAEAQPCISILNRIMEYTYGMLTAEKFGLQHLIKSMMDEMSGGGEDET